MSEKTCAICGEWVSLMERTSDAEGRLIHIKCLVNDEPESATEQASTSKPAELELAGSLRTIGGFIAAIQWISSFLALTIAVFLTIEDEIGSVVFYGWSFALFLSGFITLFGFRWLAVVVELLVEIRDRVKD